MAQYFTDFSEYTSDEQPSDWTRQWGTADLFAVRDVTGATGDKVLELAASGEGTSRRAITWDEIDDDPDKADAEIVARARWTTGGDGPGKMNRQMVRVGGSSGSEDAYWGVNDSAVDADTGVLATEKYVNNGFTEMNRTQVNEGVVEQDDWFFVRVRINGTDLKTKMWGGTVDDEPSGWDEERTDNDLSDGGVGVGSFPAEDMEWDWVGVGTDGDTAPTSDPGGGGGGSQTEDLGVVSLNLDFGTSLGVQHTLQPLVLDLALQSLGVTGRGIEVDLGVVTLDLALRDLNQRHIVPLTALELGLVPTGVAVVQEGIWGIGGTTDLTDITGID